MANRKKDVWPRFLEGAADVESLATLLAEAMVATSATKLKDLTAAAHERQIEVASGVTKEGVLCALNAHVLRKFLALQRPSSPPAPQPSAPRHSPEDRPRDPDFEPGGINDEDWDDYVSPPHHSPRTLFAEEEEQRTRATDPSATTILPPPPQEVPPTTPLPSEKEKEKEKEQPGETAPPPELMQKVRPPPAQY